MPTPASQVQLTIIQDQLGELISLEAPGAQIIALSNNLPLSVGTASAGTDGGASRSDHVHAHGNQAGGSLHAVATSGAAGFMSSADKIKLDAATAIDTANTLVLRDGTGSFSVVDLTVTGTATGDWDDGTF
jgi:hypothetical protein